LNKVKDWFFGLGNGVMAVTIIAFCFLVIYILINIGAWIMSQTLFRDVTTRVELYEWQPPTVPPMQFPPQVNLQGREIVIHTVWRTEQFPTVVENGDNELWELRQALQDRYNFTVRYTSDGRLDFGSATVDAWGFNLHEFEAFRESFLNDTLYYHRHLSGGIFWNFAKFDDAGISRFLPRTLLNENEWDWDAFEMAARVVARDDAESWALTACPHDFLQRAVIANNAEFVTIGANGNFINATGSAEFVNALAWVVELRQEWLAYHIRDGAEYGLTMFNAGLGGFTSGGGETTIHLTDEWAVLPFPRGVHVSRNYSMARPYVLALSAQLSEEEAEDIFFVLQQWTHPMENPALLVIPTHFYIPGAEEAIRELFSNRVWDWEITDNFDRSPHEIALEIIDAATPNWLEFLALHS
jgi:hypothetical protein